MRIEVKIEATTNEKRRLAGGADISPMIELLSLMLDRAMMAVVDTRLAALTANPAEGGGRESA